MKMLKPFESKDCDPNEILVLDQMCREKCECGCANRFVGIDSNKDCAQAIVCDYDGRLGEIAERMGRTFNAFCVTIGRYIAQKTNNNPNLHDSCAELIMPIYEKIQDLEVGTVITIVRIGDSVGLAIVKLPEPKIAPAPKVEKDETKELEPVVTQIEEISPAPVVPKKRGRPKGS